MERKKSENKTISLLAGKYNNEWSNGPQIFPQKFDFWTQTQTNKKGGLKILKSFITTWFLNTHKQTRGGGAREGRGTQIPKSFITTSHTHHYRPINRSLRKTCKWEAQGTHVRWGKQEGKGTKTDFFSVGWTEQSQNTLKGYKECLIWSDNTNMHIFKNNCFIWLFNCICTSLEKNVFTENVHSLCIN